MPTTKKKKTTKTCSLNDYDIISDVLARHKALVSIYSTSLLEISEKQLRDLVENKMTECATDQFDAFNYMHDRGMYKTENAPAQKIKDAQQKFCGKCK